MSTKGRTIKVVAAVAVGAALAAGGISLTSTEKPSASVQNVAPIETGEGTLGGAGAVYDPVAESKLPPRESDGDGDGVVNTKDACPWNAGTKSNGCP